MDSSIASIKSVNLKKLFKFELKFYQALMLMSKCTKVYLNIPEMIVIGFGFKTPTLFCTDYRTGELLIRENLTQQAISESFILFASNTNYSSGVPIAVCKTKHNSAYRDKIFLLFSPAECDYTWESNLSQNKGQIIQKYIRNMTTSIYKSEYTLSQKVKTFLMRKKPEKNLSKSLILKKNIERLKYLVVSSDPCSKTLISTPTIDNKMMYLVYLLEKYFIKEYNIKITQMKCNWIEDLSGKIYLLNLKDYKMASNYIKDVSPQKKMSLSCTLPTISFIKKIKDLQEKSRVSVVNLVSGPSWIKD
ncbi:hypothetical protein SteCoe_12461 [Stentor coeruleus]|uniref:Uncharacterized protein n=1 Tax=Stentor coeruleus TaxID=5963 RepID=A0A1R2CAS5_9CILI|nr:hypothetical protein SteCoe_12461 [Stentor coeruleus]